MRRIVCSFVSLAIIATLTFSTGASASAQITVRNTRVVLDTIRTLNSQIDDLLFALDFEERHNGGGRELRKAYNALELLGDKVVVLEENAANRHEHQDDLKEIILATRNVDGILRSATIHRGLERKWAAVKTTIDSLALQYGVTSTSYNRAANRSLNPKVPPAAQMPQTTTTGLNGTYELDVTRTENVSDAILNSNVTGAEKVDLETKLEAPQQIAIRIRGSQVTLASSKAPMVTFVADGSEKTENVGGKTTRQRATFRGQDLVISSLGDEMDYTVTFSPLDNGNALKVTRRVTTEFISETIFAESFYKRTDTSARLGIERDDSTAPDTGTYSSTDPDDNKTVIGRSPSVVTPRLGEFVVPNGTMVTGLLENPIDTKVSQNNDRFRMTVQSPEQFRGAIVEGHITGVGRSGQVSGRSNITFNFTKITLRDGKSYDFAGTLQSIRDAQGKNVKVDAEGIAKSDSQTKETVKRGGIGAGAGALIGAIFGGGKGAAIGAIIGGGAGAGSVIVQGREDIKLQQGSMLTVAASSPTRNNDPQISESN